MGQHTTLPDEWIACNLYAQSHGVDAGDPSTTFDGAISCTTAGAAIDRPPSSGAVPERSRNAWKLLHVPIVLRSLACPNPAPDLSALGEGVWCSRQRDGRSLGCRDGVEAIVSAFGGSALRSGVAWLLWAAGVWARAVAIRRSRDHTDYIFVNHVRHSILACAMNDVENGRGAVEAGTMVAPWVRQLLG